MDGGGTSPRMGEGRIMQAQLSRATQEAKAEGWGEGENSESVVIGGGVKPFDSADLFHHCFMV
jgi:hypothetical protein